MIRKHMFLAVASLAALSALPAKAMACTEAEVPAVVKDLGYWAKSPDWQHAMGCLDKHGQIAAGLLLDELHPIPETDITLANERDHKAGIHVIWCVRGLRYLTGLNFMAGSAAEIRKQKMPDDRKYWILLQSGDSVKMYGTWMSRDETFIAPPDIQAAVIAKWKAWYAADGANFKYRNDMNFIDWFF